MNGLRVSKIHIGGDWYFGVLGDIIVFSWLFSVQRRRASNCKVHVGPCHLPVNVLQAFLVKVSTECFCCFEAVCHSVREDLGDRILIDVYHWARIPKSLSFHRSILFAKPGRKA